MTSRNLKNYYAHYVLVLLCLMMIPLLIYWIAWLFSPNYQIILDLSGVEVPALYKRAYRNEDGSIDLTVHIPASASLLKKYNVTLTDVNEDYEEVREDRKTLYPLTIDSPYLINNPELCREMNPLHVLVIVHTSTSNFQRRRLIRETWASKHVMSTRNVSLLFLLGQTKDAKTQLLIENEHVVYGDLLQGQFLDSYHNLTHKGVLAYRWIHQYCSHAQLILKVDDDVFVNPFLLHEVYFPRFRQANRTIACHVRPKDTSPIVRHKSKWMVQEYQFRGYRFYPFPYCNGYVVLITPDIIKALYKAAYTTPFFWVDDVYLYGMLAARIGNVKHVNILPNVTVQMSNGLNCYRTLNCSMLASGVYEEEAVKEMWQLSLKHISPSIKSQINPIYLVT